MDPVFIAAAATEEEEDRLEIIFLVSFFRSFVCIYRLKYTEKKRGRMKISTSICIIVMLLATNYYAILNDTIMILILQFYSRWILLLTFYIHNYRF